MPKQFIQARLSMISVTVVRKTCLAMILCPGPLKYLFHSLNNIDVSLGVRHYPVLPSNSFLTAENLFCVKKTIPFYITLHKILELVCDNFRFIKFVGIQKHTEKKII